jgi:hypothetical protein
MSQSKIFSLIGKDKNLEMFLLATIIVHMTLYTIESTSLFTKNFQIQVRKLRKNNIEQFLYLVTSIIVFVVASGLGFNATSFTESFEELKLFVYVYVTSLVIAFICNALCAMTEPVIPQLDSNGEPPTPFLGNYPNGVPFLSKNRNSFFFNIAQYLLEVSYKIQSIILSFIGIGIVAAYTVAYPFGLLSRSLQ